MPVYLDHAATTPLRAEAAAAYVEALALVGNPASIHSHGQAAKRVLEDARSALAAALGVDPIQVTFTSGGTESINLALKGLFWRRNRDGSRPRILATRAEHHATIDALHWLAEHEGAVVEWIPVDGDGRIDLAALAAMIGSGGAAGASAGGAAGGGAGGSARDAVGGSWDGSARGSGGGRAGDSGGGFAGDSAAGAGGDVALVTTLLANNEVGTIQPVDEIIRIAGDIPVHVDAVGAWGQVPLPSGAAALSVSAHKLGGPVGVGALVLRRDVTVEPLIHGGSQQASRAGTQDVAGAVAFAAVAGLPHDDTTALRDALIAGVRAVVPDAVLRGHPTERLGSNAHFTFPGCDGDSLLYLLDAAGVSVSTGSACTAGVAEASHVLIAMGLPEPVARGALRFTLGHGSTAADVDALLSTLPSAVARARRAGLS